MRLDKNDRDALAATLNASGFVHDTGDLVCLAFSKPTVDGNKAVHLKANEQLLEVLIREEPGLCYHVTGEMRALADPFHRRLCAELVKRAGSRFIVIYNIPEEFRDTPEGVGRWNALSWESKSWAERLSAINLIGDEIVEVRAYNTLEEIQYSVFGNRYVLLQEKHSDEGNASAPTPKRVWLLRSPRLNEYLTAKAINIARAAHDVPEALFRRFSARVNGITSRIILNTLARNGGEAPADETVDRTLQAFDADAARDLDILKAIGFVTSEPAGSLRLTPAGDHYLSSVGARQEQVRG